ncbi:hypothetical protein [Enterovirga sp. CN4-39]|uniref:hypothetical protein n=1 Tax=Enterovirga sp. CN4-39 TaxID=3400910 RepID=UPI003BFDB877
MSRKLDHAIAEAARETSEAVTDSIVTIAARLPILARAALMPTPDGLAEWHRASSEKLVAAWEGAFAVGAAWNAMLWRTLISPATPTGMAHEALVLVRAASRPGHDRVRANAERLGRLR